MKLFNCFRATETSLGQPKPQAVEAVPPAKAATTRVVNLDPVVAPKEEHQNVAPPLYLEPGKSALKVADLG